LNLHNEIYAAFNMPQCTHASPNSACYAALCRIMPRYAALCRVIPFFPLYSPLMPVMPRYANSSSPPFVFVGSVRQWTPWKILLVVTKNLFTTFLPSGSFWTQSGGGPRHKTHRKWSQEGTIKRTLSGGPVSLFVTTLDDLQYSYNVEVCTRLAVWCIIWTCRGKLS
jgi:hypothetical protein